MSAWILQACGMLLSIAAMAVLIVLTLWMCALVAGFSHWLRWWFKRKRGESIREHADHVQRDWEKWHAEQDASGGRLSLSQQKRLKVQLRARGARFYQDGEEVE